jgi:hypothetical protein
MAIISIAGTLAAGRLLLSMDVLVISAMGKSPHIVAGRGEPGIF